MRCFITLIFCPCLCLLPPIARAQDAIKVLDSHVVATGGRTITYQRVEPPKEVAKAAVAISSAPSGVSPAQRVMPKMLSLSTTVHDHAVTDLRWTFNGGDYRAWSTIDFNHLRSVSKFEQDGVTYSLVFGIGNQLGLDEWLPAELSRKAAASSFVVVSAPEKTDADAGAYAGVTALHRYYDAHKTELIAAWEESEVNRIANEQWQKEHPPVPKDTVIRFWPKQGSQYLEAGKEAK